MSSPEPTGRIDGHARTVRELLDNAKYSIDFYQREYAWQERQVSELLDDLTGKFLDFYEDKHERHEVERYGHYFLGSVVISHKRGRRFVVDGQQRLTTLTLLLIYLHHLQQNRDDRVDVRKLIFSEKFGRKSFNLDVPDRVAVMQQLFEGEPPTVEGANESVQNIAVRYANVADHFPEEVTERALPFFVDWLLENVHLVEIEAYSDEDAYMIFETMNDRGLSLSLPEMLKGYVLANIRREGDQRSVDGTWKKLMQSLKEFGDEGDVHFFKNWLRARHAETIRPGKKGAENKDYERIGSEFHRWVRDQRDRIGLAGTNDFLRFVERDLNFYARQTLTIRAAAQKVTDGLESIFYSSDRGFTLQTQVLLAPLEPSDSADVVRRKMALAADYLDIWLARRIWNFRTMAYSSVRYTIFTLTKDLRGKTLPELSAHLRGLLDAESETFAKQPRYRLHHQNYRQVRHVLARLTHWLELECGLASHFEDLVSKGRARPFEIEHVWANQYDRFRDWFPHPSEFETERNRIGGLVLLQRGLNQSLGDSTYEDKRDAYVSHGQNLLARSLHPLAYQNNPSFRALIERTGLPFRFYDTFDQAAQAERQELYLRMAEWVWNPSRLDLDGVKPPIPEPIEEPEEDSGVSFDAKERARIRRAFWTKLIERAQGTDSIHSHLSPTKYHWLGARREGMWWNFVVLQGATRVELYIDLPDAAVNKALFDALIADKPAVEADFGEVLDWQRLDDKRASRISITISGGWVDEDKWEATIDQALAGMKRLHSALGKRVEAAR